ncbi:hypothetical protein [Campylobacter cuniculorum]|uniref:Ferrochelatase n=2 Tax=Campylobacter cuniculorum TaxID=374106 RepID=A0A1W6BWZ5_9BACT|nr:hypothetical protein [Campylobacter cuniculorum]ARJ56629.1 hypothetical protein CCUN_1028 [Campylobacter cuniculorum DSM 23162 = LMG 24588]QOR04103.1 hypothetical protein A0071_08055 [Campylobacter cuniculorum]
MNISNLSELLNASMINEGSTLSVDGFALNLNQIKSGFAFFSNIQNEINEAIKKGAFVIVFDKDIKMTDLEVFYLKVENLENALFRLLRFLCENKELHFLLTNRHQFNFSKAFRFKNLSGNVFLDFQNLIEAKKEDFFCFCDENYLLKFCANCEFLKPSSYTILSHSSLFWTSLICEDLYFKNLRFPFIYAEIFAQFIAFLKEKGMKIDFDLKKLDFFKSYFINQNMQITKFGEGFQAFILVFNEEDFDFFQENCQHIKGFKTSRKNSLFCDFSYNEIKDLKNFKAYTYCLVLIEDEENFLNSFETERDKEITLFD